MVRTKSVSSRIEPQKDGLRILATRFRGRGLQKNRYHVWMANLGPSEKLLNQRNISWREFSLRYKNELLEETGVDKKNKIIKNKGQKFTLRLLKHLSTKMTITLLCHCAEEEKECHRHILKELLSSKI